MTTILSVSRALGGLVCNVGIDLARLDPTLPILAIGGVGSDDNGRLIRQEFARYSSIDTSCLWSEGITSFTDVMTVAATGERTFFTYKGADGTLTPERLSAAPLETCRLLHIGYALLLDGMDAPDAEYGTAMARALAEAQARGVETSIDVVSQRGGRFREIVPLAFRYVDHLTVNEYEAAQITGIELNPADSHLPEALRRALHTLRDMGVKRRVVIHLPQMAAGLDENDRFACVPTLALPEGYICGSVGAGDAFTAALLQQTVRGASLEDALQAGNAVAACSLSQPGSTEGVPTLEEALKLYERFPLRRI